MIAAVHFLKKSDPRQEPNFVTTSVNGRDKIIFLKPKNLENPRKAVNKKHSADGGCS